jgi:hypothetical protein
VVKGLTGCLLTTILLKQLKGTRLLPRGRVERKPEEVTDVTLFQGVSFGLLPPFLLMCSVAITFIVQVCIETIVQGGYEAVSCSGSLWPNALIKTLYVGVSFILVVTCTCVARE